MIYGQYPYYLFNQNLFSTYNGQLTEQPNKYLEQQKKIADLVKATSDFIKAAKDIEPEFEQQAAQAFFTEVMRQMEIDRSAQR